MKLLLLLFIACSAFAHEGEPLRPHDLSTAWRFDPGIVIPLVLSLILYLRGRERNRTLVGYFLAGWTTLVVALVSPLHPLGEALFSAHMAQHELLMVVAAPLLIISHPLAPLLRGMPWSIRTASVKTFRITSALALPFTAWLLHAVVLWGWHIPVLFQATLESDFIHSLQHISFLGSALLFWWALLDPRSTAARHRGSALLYVASTAVHTSILGWLLTFSQQPWYPAYAPRTADWGLTPLQDQQLGGLIMWVPAGFTYLLAILWLMSSWIRESGLRAFAIRIGPLALLLLTLSCSNTDKVKNSAAILSGGNPDAGKNKIQYYGCPACHTIPGIQGADGLVGPSLARIASRVYIGGVLENNPENMKRWLRNPRAVDPLTAMPNMFIPDKDARDIAGYLYTLR